MLKELGIIALAAAEVIVVFFLIGYLFSKVIIPLFKN
jgi:hypothetical protein